MKEATGDLSMTAVAVVIARVAGRIYNTNMAKY